MLGVIFWLLAPIVFTLIVAGGVFVGLLVSLGVGNAFVLLGWR